jgi:hypothetical protein
MIVTLTARPDMAPVPRVEIELQELSVWDGGTAASAPTATLDGGGPSSTGPAVSGGTASMNVVTVPDGTNRVTLWRRDGERRREVRGVIDVPFSTAKFGALDREAGRGVVSSYELDCHTAFGTTTTVLLGEVVLPAPSERSETVIQQPFNAGLHAVVTETAANVESITRQAPGELVYLEGGAYPRLVGFGPRRSLTGVELRFYADTRQAASDVWATLGDELNPQLAAWLVRSTHPLLPAVFFCEVRSLQEVDVDLAYGGTRSQFVAVVTEIEPPAPGIATPAIRYSDLVAAIGPSYTALGAALPRYSQWGTAWEFASAG